MMMKSVRLLFPCLWLAACQSVPPEEEAWTAFLTRADRMDAPQLQLAREAAMKQYTDLPNDSNRLRAAYLLSRPEASLQQLQQSREILAGISAGSDLAALGALMDEEIQRTVEAQKSELGTLQLQLRLIELHGQLGELQKQLNALKEIEQEMGKSQQEADEVHP
jgi:hypothetical protein